MSRQRHRRQILVTDLDPEWVAAAVQLGVDPQAVWVVVTPISSTITSWLVSGRPRQFIETR
jgi:hypothetical protein